MPIFERIDKPALLLDEPRARRNIEWMAEKARRSGILFRPHFKTHQSLEIGRWFREAGTHAITVSSVDMAEYFINDGWRDVTIAFPVNLRQLPAIDRLAERADLNLLVESGEAIAALESGLNHPAGAWIKVDVGAGRTGLDAGQAGPVVALARQIQKGKRLKFQGLLTHAGHTYRAGSPAEIEQLYADSIGMMAALREALEEGGFSGVQISYGDTPSCRLVESFHGVDEIRPGNFVFYDAMQYRLGVCRWEEIAVAVACPVVARHPERGTLIVYGGAVHLSKEAISIDGSACYGLVALPDGAGWGPPLEGARVASLSQEHGVLRVATQDLQRFQIGDLVVVIPVHSCLAVDLMERYHTLDGRVISTLGKGYL